LTDLGITNRDVDGNVVFGFTGTYVSGLEQLLQIVAKTVLQSIGSDKLFALEGGDIISYHNANYFDALKQELAINIMNVEKDLKSKQLEAPADEALSQIQLLNVTFDKQTLSVTLFVENQAGERALLPLPAIGNAI